MKNKATVIILAAGQGKRMHQAFPGTPKVLVPLHGVPMLVRVLDAVEASGVADKIVIVVGPVVEEKVRTALFGRNVHFVLQPEPLGTGHAVLSAREATGTASHVLVLYGDQPLVSANTIQQMVDAHERSHAPVTMLSVPLSDFKEWRSSFADFGRVIRDADHKFEKSVEVKDASGHELAVTEVNPSLYCFDAAWLWEHLPLVGTENTQHEYYLPDVLRTALLKGVPVETVPLKDAREALGANTPEQVEILEEVFQKMSAG